MILERLEVGAFMTNCYLVGCPQTLEGLIIDPGAEGKRIIRRATDLKLKIKYILNTHGHMDHTGANSEVKSAFQVPLLAHRVDAPLYRSRHAGAAMFGETVKETFPDYLLKGTEQLRVGTLTVSVLETPGHTPGSISLDIGGILFTGDTLFAGSIGRTDLPGGSYRQIIASIKKKLLPYPDVTKIFPGHGPPSTIGNERHYNPFLT